MLNALQKDSQSFNDVLGPVEILIVESATCFSMPIFMRTRVFFLPREEQAEPVEM